MEFGIFNSLYVPHQVTDGVPDPQVVQHERLMDEITWTKAADRSGFKYTWATEHHFLTEYSHLSANESFLAYLAGVTDRIHLGSGIFNITPPVNHPARVAERVAMIDHLSEGRMEFGVGRGSSRSGVHLRIRFAKACGSCARTRSRPTRIRVCIQESSRSASTRF